METITLYKNNKGGISTWSVYCQGNILMRSFQTVEGGAKQVYCEEVKTNQSGRTLEQQMALMAESYASRMKDKGYKLTIREALVCATNQLGLDRPMLAQQMDKVKNVNYDGAALQYKLNGHRCLITKRDGEMIAYTRQGKLIHTIPHILNDLSFLPEGETVDGELYIHGEKLQHIASLIKRSQQDSERLNFIAYDIMRPEPFQDRFNYLKDIMTQRPEKSLARLLLYKLYSHPLMTNEFLDQSIKMGFEGLILRTNDTGYEAGIRSRSLIKIKKFVDQEFSVIDIHPSKEGWAVCTCIMINGKTFDVSAPGTHYEKFQVMRRKEEYIGRRLTVSYPELTADGKVFQPTAIAWREDV